MALAQPQPAGANKSLASHATPLTAILTAICIDAAPNLDGQVRNDPAWGNAVSVSTFWQTTPDEGQPATQRTEVRVVYMADTI